MPAPKQCHAVLTTEKLDANRRYRRSYSNTSRALLPAGRVGLASTPAPPSAASGGSCSRSPLPRRCVVVILATGGGGRSLRPAHWGPATDPATPTCRLVKEARALGAECSIVAKHNFGPDSQGMGCQTPSHVGKRRQAEDNATKYPAPAACSVPNSCRDRQSTWHTNPPFGQGPLPPLPIDATEGFSDQLSREN